MNSKIISRRDYLSPSRLFLICSNNGNSFPIKMSYPNEFNLGGNCLKRLAGKKYATMAFERSSCTGILWNVFRAETGFPRSLSEICEQIYCHVLIHPGCYLSKCSLLHVYERNAKFTLSLIHSGMFDDHQSDDNQEKNPLKQPGQIKLNCLITPGPPPTPSNHRRLFLFLGITQPATSVTPSQTLCAA